jgi:hypothetical protein
MLQYNMRRVEMVPFNCLNDPILKNAKTQILCSNLVFKSRVIFPLSCTCKPYHGKPYNAVLHTKPSCLLFDSHDEFVIEILHPSPNTKRNH